MSRLRIFVLGNYCRDCLCHAWHSSRCLHANDHDLRLSRENNKDCADCADGELPFYGVPEPVEYSGAGGVRLDRPGLPVRLYLATSQPSCTIMPGRSAR
jgi:hypothetical protein